MKRYIRTADLGMFLGMACLFAIPGISNADTVPVTTNLLANLNGDSTDNFVSNGTLVQVWKDLAENGSNESRQDFGQGLANRQPGLLAGTAVPNSASTGITYAVLDFDRSVTVANNRNSSTNSDTLKGKFPLSIRPANYGDEFTVGADSAYEATEATGLSWMIVFRSSDQPLIMTNNNLPTGSGSGGTTSRWGQQAPFDVTYADTATAGADWIGTYLFDKPADAPDFNVNLSSHVRDTDNNEIHNDPTPLETSNLTDNKWYMMANAYDPENGTMRTVLTTPDGSGGITTIMDVTKAEAAMQNFNGLGNAGLHVASALGTFANSTGSNNDWAFDGLMAEVLVYNSPLNTTDMDSVIDYLNNKYFVGTIAAGDHNADGVVDAADYVAWRKFDPGNPTGYDDFVRDFGIGGGGSGGGGSIPEPTTIWLLGVATGLLFLRARLDH